MANLWDVTDVDIDRFTGAVLDCWTDTPADDSLEGCSDSTGDAVERKRRSTQAQGSVATAKAADSTHARGRGRANPSQRGRVTGQPGGAVAETVMHPGDASGQPQCIAATVAAARAVCRLPHLIGAAPVCYGVPTFVVPQTA